MIRKSMCFALVMIAVVVLVGPIQTVCAEESESFGQAKRFEVEPFLGYHYFEDRQNLKDHSTYGARLGYNFSNHFGVEGALGAVNTNVDDSTRTGAVMGQYRSPTDDVDLSFYQLNGIYQFTPEKRFTPFVVAGFGNFRYDPEVLDNNTNTLDYGLGAKYWIKKDMAIRVDLRDMTDQTYHNYSATVGVVFAFGGKEKRTPPAMVTTDPEPKEEEVVVVSEESPMVEEKVRELVSGPEEEKTIILAFEDVHFRFDQSTLTDAAKVILKRNIRILQEHPKTRVRIVGYTSASGSVEYNQRLSERRAKSVESYLVNEGLIAPDRLVTIGYGESNPAEHEPAPKQLYSKAAMANMRVIFETILN